MDITITIKDGIVTLPKFKTSLVKSEKGVDNPTTVETDGMILDLSDWDDKAVMQKLHDALTIDVQRIARKRGTIKRTMSDGKETVEHDMDSFREYLTSKDEIKLPKPGTRAASESAEKLAVTGREQIQKKYPHVDKETIVAYLFGDINLAELAQRNLIAAQDAIRAKESK